MATKKVASAYVDLQLQTAQFKAAVGEAQNEMKKFSAQMREQTEKSRESVRLLSESIGLGIPRGLQNVIAKLPGVTTAMNLAFDSVVVIALIHVVVEAGEKITEFARRSEEAAKKHTEAWAEATKDVNSTTVQLAIVDSRIDDTIAKLEKRPGSNGMKTALLEASDEAAKLGDKLDKDLQKLSDVKVSGGLASLFPGGINQANQAASAAALRLQEIIDEYRAPMQSSSERGDTANYNELRRDQLSRIATDPKFNKAFADLVEYLRVNQDLVGQHNSAFDNAANAYTILSGSVEALNQQGVKETGNQQVLKLQDAAAAAQATPYQKALFEGWMRSGQEHLRSTEQDTHEWNAALPETFNTQQKERDDVSMAALRREIEGNRRDVEALAAHAQIVSATDATSRAGAAATYSAQAEDIKNGGLTPGRRIAALQAALAQEHDLETKAYRDELDLYNDGSAQYQRVLAEKIKADGEYYRQQGDLQREVQQQSIGAVFDTMVRRSQDFNAQFKDLLSTTVNDINDSILKLLTEKNDQHPFQAAGKAIFTSVARTGLQDAEGGLLKVLGLGSGKPDGSHSNPIYTRDADKIVGGGAGSGFMSWANDSNFMGKLFGGKLFGPGGLFDGNAIPDGSNGALAKGLGMGVVHPQESGLPGILNTIGQLGVKFATAGMGGASASGASGSGSYADVQNAGDVGGFFNANGDYIPVPGMAGGGVMSPGDWYLTGEQGPELLQVGSTSRINNARDTAALFSGPTTTHNHNWHVDARGSNDPAAIHAAVQRGIAQAVPHLVAATKASSHDDKRRAPVRH